MNATRKIIRIDTAKCDGCGLCASACAEGAIEIVRGKARLVSESYCDGLGACLAECPRGAISLDERCAAEFDGEEVRRNPEERGALPPAPAFSPLCPPAAGIAAAPSSASPSLLGNWPVQLRLVSPGSPFLRGANLLVTADCVPFAVGDFHRRYLEGRAVVVGCPKLDDTGFLRERLRLIVEKALPASLMVLRMEVPCCGGIARALVEARDRAAPLLPVEVHTVGVRGTILIETVPPRSP